MLSPELLRALTELEAHMRDSSAMTHISAVKDPRVLEPLWSAVFDSGDAFGAPFQPRISQVIAFYPTANYRLTEAQYSAVLAGIRCLGEDEFFISHTERARGAFDPRESGEHVDDWSCQLPTYAEYVSTPVFLENALYSASGAWGVLLSHEEHAVLGGTAAFVGAVKESYHEWRDDLRRLAEFWRANPHGDWIEAFVARCGRTDT